MQEIEALQETERMRQQAETERLEAKLRFDAEQKALDRDTQERVAEIRAAGYTAMNDRDMNQQNDYIDTLEYLDKKNAKEADQAIAREREVNRSVSEQKKLELQRQELLSKERIAEKQLQIARTNKNKYDKK
jgi:hypothetical protein